MEDLIMNKHTKIKMITTVICLIISLFALYTFAFIAEISKGERTVLIVIAIFWILSGISNLIGYIRNEKERGEICR